ncbi:MAG TPA: hypothetical protein DEV64_01225 [Rhodospirillaceae bacterium]|nr:hypothetical protein [Rhodospirillaceae bacterium]
MVIMRAGSLDEAKAIAASDPMHSSGARDFTVRPWLMNEGTMTVKIRFSDGSRELVLPTPGSKEKYGCRPTGPYRAPDTFNTVPLT